MGTSEIVRRQDEARSRGTSEEAWALSRAEDARASARMLARVGESSSCIG